MVVTPRLVVACWMRPAWTHQQSGLQRVRQRVLEPSQQLEMAPELGMAPSLPQALVSGKAHSQPLEPLLA
jgi:hypothetical protein